MYNYIFIAETGDIRKLIDVSEDDLQMAEEGYCDIIRLSDLMQYVDGEWKEVLPQ